MIAWCARHPTAANLLMAIFIILGVVTLPGLQRETFPEIKSDKVEVKILYPGATAEEAEDALCRRLEDGLEGITDLDELRCDAREGMATLTAVMREGANMMRFLDDINAEVDAIDDFPDSAERPVIQELARTQQVISIAVTGPDDAVALKAYAEQLKDRLQSLSAVAEVTMDGFSEHQIRIEIPAWRLRQYGLSAVDIANAVQRRSVSQPVGRLEGGSEDLLLRLDDQRKGVEDFENLVVISGQSGASLRLGEIAKITDRFDRDEDKILFDGKRAAILNIFKTRAQDILKVRQSIVEFVRQEPTPQGITLTLSQDRSSVVQDRLNMLVSNGIQGLILVFLVLWLFFSLRYSFWVTMGLPVSFLGAFFLLPLVGVSINMISMVGLLIGVGLLMDDAIVIAENIAARMDRGESPLQAAIKGSKQVFPGVISSFATTILVFGSLVFITGEMGQILRVIPLVLILVLSVSLLEAFIILPHHLSHALEHMAQRQNHPWRDAFERRFAHFRDHQFGPLLDRAINERYLTIGLVGMLLLFALAMPAGGLLKFVPFPDLDGDVVEARLLLPQGTPLSRTESLVEHLQQAAQRVNARLKTAQPGGVDLIQHISVIFGQNPDAYESGPHVARVITDLLGAEIRNTNLDQFTSAWRQEVGELADVIALKFTEPTLGPGGRAIDMRLRGPDLNQLKQASTELQQWLGGYAGVLDLSDDLRPGKREFRLHLKPAAGVLGLDARAVAEQLRGAFQGITVDEFPADAERYVVDLRLSAADRDSAEDLDDFTLVGSNGVLIPLSVVVDLQPVRGWARIHRVDGERAVTIQGDVDRRFANAQELMSLAKAGFIPKLLADYPGITFDPQGQGKESAKTGQSIMRNVLLGMIGVYMLLALQFRGYMAPLTVMLVIPTAFIGVVFGHLVMGLDLTMPSIVGMASLFGVVVNDSILMVVFIREQRAAGIPTMVAAKEAGRARLRPILLTSITTVAGLMPLLLERSLQAQILIPLATSLAFGLAVATLGALFVVPSVYCILDDHGKLERLHGEQDA
ncbi:acriflavin resistance protein [Magnetococcus marinus MC-1]|uniref:Acriflavin resistance protein n=1 Tax=Magnetococcus marinus (strain ATCC BAA-1437 / JCM 17883 / MC-1) TaxID=156889 RepID=A0LCI5_MAGMM|nr:efflux RND transporter permease subunit [Magnetococcus marinus]ABK45678.1 acriflavin resistance protein [Magnetococcus marinus MC-1]